MRRKRQHINVLLLHINRQMSRRLYRIRMEQNTFFPAYLSNCLYRLDRPDLIIGIHHADKAGIVTNSIRHLLRQYNSVFMNIQQGNLKSFFFQFL